MKIKIIILVVICFILFVTVRIGLSIKYGRHITVSRSIGIMIPFSTEIECKDSHGGFHGDGECVIKVYFSDEQATKFKEKINKNSHWNQLPMPDRLQKVVGACMDKNMYVPIIENGYYFFKDRHSKADDKYNPNEMFEEDRGSSNYTVAVFDTDENILYFYELDT